MPAEIPVKVLVPLIVAGAVLLMLQVPPVVASLKVTELPIQMLTAPDGVIAAGAGLTVTTVVVKHVVPNV